VRQLKEGTVFLKFGRKGQPHFRQVYCDKKLLRIHWCEGKGKKAQNVGTDRYIAVSDVCDVTIGREHVEFQRVKSASDDYFEHTDNVTREKSFSIISQSGQSLHLEALNKKQAQSFLMNMRTLLTAKGAIEEGHKVLAEFLAYDDDDENLGYQ